MAILWAACSSRVGGSRHVRRARPRVLPVAGFFVAEHWRCNFCSVAFARNNDSHVVEVSEAHLILAGYIYS